MSGWTVETVAGIGGTQYRVLDEAGMLVAMFTREGDAERFLAGDALRAACEMMFRDTGNCPICDCHTHAKGCVLGGVL